MVNRHIANFNEINESNELEPNYAYTTNSYSLTFSNLEQ